MSLIYILSLCAVGGYFLGSIPFGLFLCKLFGFGDIRKVGSGNIGATNVLRVSGSKSLTLLTIALDASKAAIAAYLACKFVGGEHALLASLVAGTSAVVGHNFPIWLGFKGGKGVASAFGFILFETPIIALLALATWIVTAIISRYSSLSAILAASLVPVYTYFFTDDTLYLAFYLPIVLLILVRHHANFKRLFKGEESKITFKKKAK
ncbi:MAG: glycerol-3-phosphate 1-O-acyltransferase PlsY [Alphaproteobacteria bacterium]|nr:glycerol-3-phosphate 1-O-acyltransferase PlsY [Alphaproteobacteria bacterium]